MPIPTNPRVCHSCLGVILEEPKASQLKAYPGRGKFCSGECSIEGELKQCTVCRKWFRAYKGNGRLCKTCRETPYKEFDDIKRKAWSIGANILGGKGKTEWLVELIGRSLGSPCPYCGVKLTLLNLSLDHIEPIGTAELRRKKADNVALRAHTDRKENLQLTCRSCNSLKSNFTDAEFREFLGFIKNWSGKDKMMKRLAQSLGVWSHKRH